MATTKKESTEPRGVSSSTAAEKALAKAMQDPVVRDRIIRYDAIRAVRK